MIPVSFFSGIFLSPLSGFVIFVNISIFYTNIREKKKKAARDLGPLKRNARGSRETDLFPFFWPNAR